MFSTIAHESQLRQGTILRGALAPGRLAALASLVQIASTWQGAGGIGGFFERAFAPRAARAMYQDELNRLATYARERRGS